MKHLMPRWSPALILIGLWGPLSADEPVRDHDIVVEDYFSLGVVTGCELSPDGRHVAYTETRWEPPREDRNVDLWVVSTESKAVQRLTFDAGADVAPQWSPDGRFVYYWAGPKRAGEDRPPYDGKRQVWRVSVEGGEPFPVTRVPEGVGAYQLTRDGKTLYYTVSKKQVSGDWKDLKEKFGDLEYGRGVVQATQLWKLDLTSWRAEKLIDEGRVIHEFSVAPDQSRIAMITLPSENLIDYEGWSRVDVYDAQTKRITSPPDKQWRADAPAPYGWLLSLAWSDDGRSLAFRIDFDGYPGELFIAQFADDGSVQTWKLDRPGEVTLGAERVEWLPGQKALCFIAQDHARQRVYCAKGLVDGKQGQALTLTPGDACVGAFSLSRSADRAAVVMSTTTHPEDVFMVSGYGEGMRYDRLTQVNPQVETWKLPSIEIVKWTSEDGTEVEGILELPPGHEKGKPLPMLVEIHGGPTAATLYRMRFWIYGRTLFAARGWAVLSPNYRGSTGYGDKFLIDLIGHENHLDVMDVLSGVDAMIERGIADEDRLAVMGWSNGGYLTNCLITRTDRFQAASSGAGVFDMTMQWLAEDTPGHVINYQQGFPWTRAEAMKAASPLYAVDKVRTPTLIHVGEKDERCPPEHSRGLHRALHQYLNVPCELVVYPGEPHGLTKYTHRKAKMEWDLRWLDHYVLETPPGESRPQDPISMRN